MDVSDATVGEMADAMVVMMSDDSEAQNVTTMPLCRHAT